MIRLQRQIGICRCLYCFLSVKLPFICSEAFPTKNAPPNSAVTVNGQLASVTRDGTFFVNEVALQIGANAIPITLTTQDGQTATQTITINRAGSAPFKVRVEPQEGFAPLTSTFTVESPSNASFDHVAFYFNGNATAGFVAHSLAEANAGFTLGAGLTSVTVKFFDILGNLLYSTTKRISAYEPVEKYLLAKGVFSDVEQRLKAGDIASAATLFVEGRRSDYVTYFTSLGTSLPTVGSQLGIIRGATLTERHSEFTTVRDTVDGPTAFPIHIIRGTDGIWRIESM